MPHIVMEYSANLADAFDVQGTVDDLHEAAIGSALFDVAAIRTRAVCRDHYRIADGNPANGFVHVVVRIREGRSDAQKEALGTGLLAALEKRLEKAFAGHPLAVTVEVHDITQPTFRRNTIRSSGG